jgi:hypothetical protein
MERNIGRRHHLRLGRRESGHRRRVRVVDRRLGLRSYRFVPVGLRGGGIGGYSGRDHGLGCRPAQRMGAQGESVGQKGHSTFWALTETVSICVVWSTYLNSAFNSLLFRKRIKLIQA